MAPRCDRTPPGGLRPRGRTSGESGFSIFEVMLGTAVLVIALLGHMASTFSEYRLAKTDETRSEVLHLARQFVGRMRSDEDWANLYPRLRALQTLSELTTTGGTRLEDGRQAWPPEHYYPDFVTPSWLESMHVLIDVPYDVAQPDLLREDLLLPHYGLPADLNGDGTIDASSRVDDYRALPVMVTMRWQPPGEPPAEMRLYTWLRGYR